MHRYVYVCLCYSPYTKVWLKTLLQCLMHYNQNISPLAIVCLIQHISIVRSGTKNNHSVLHGMTSQFTNLQGKTAVDPTTAVCGAGSVAKCCTDDPAGLTAEPPMP